MFVDLFQIEHKDLLVVLSDSGKLSLLYFCSEMHRLVLFASVLCPCSLFVGTTFWLLNVVFYGNA